MIYTTFALCRKAGACTERYKYLAEKLGGVRAYGNKPIPIATVLEINGLDDALWALRAAEPTADCARIARLFACDCAERVLPLYETKYPGDGRSRVAIDTAWRYAMGEATADELAAAGDAAWAAAGAAARDAAGAAAGAAAWAAAWAAAGAAECEWQAQRLAACLREGVK